MTAPTSSVTAEGTTPVPVAAPAPQSTSAMNGALKSERGSTERLLGAIVDEARRLEEDALQLSAGHNEEARAAEYQHKLLGVPIVLLAAAAGVTSFSTAGAPPSVAFWASVAAGAISFGVAALTGVATFLDPKSRAAEHYKASNEYYALRDQARYFHQIECKKEMDVAELDRQLVALLQRLAELNEQTPNVSKNAAANAHTEIAGGEYAYAVDKERHG